jgi:hypothetical protein
MDYGLSGHSDKSQSLNCIISKLLVTSEIFRDKVMSPWHTHTLCTHVFHPTVCSNPTDPTPSPHVQISNSLSCRGLKKIWVIR